MRVADYAGRAVIVTGGTRGIGAGIARAFLEAGAQVLICSRTEPSGAAPLPGTGGRMAVFTRADVRDPAQAQRLIGEAADCFGGVDVVVSNAGGSPAAAAATASPRLHAKVVELNLIAPLHVAQAANAVMQGQPEGGSIIMIGSVSGTRPSPETAAYGLSGQVCLAQTRALVQRDVADEFLAMAEMIGGMVSYGNPFDPAVTSSPLINTRQLERVLALIEAGKADGARLVCGGARSEGDLAAGNFIAPTLFTDVSNDMSIAREEIFGPVLSVIPFADEDEAIRIANDTEYGLAATVWTSDIKRAMRMTKAIRAGTVGINGYQLEPHAAFGGYHQSGLGREGGRAAIEAYTELKTVLLPFTDEMM
jgi:NADP-dependent 3-hydroxy acid dehydrogenase YdfG